MISRVLGNSPSTSKQDYETPRWLIRACEERWGTFTLDLAAREDNKRAPACITPEMDSFNTEWPKNVLCWLNPPFAKLGPWAQRCREQGARVVMLTPASVSTEWYAKYVYGFAHTILLRPRFAFDGMPVNPKTGKVDPFPKDLMLTLWNIMAEPGFELWKVKAPKDGNLADLKREGAELREEMMLRTRKMERKASGEPHE